MARELIVEGTKRAMRRLKAGEIKPVVLLDLPVRLEMRFRDTGAADVACMMPGVERVDGRTILFVADDVKTAAQAFYCQTRLQRTRLL